MTRLRLALAPRRILFALLALAALGVVFSLLLAAIIHFSGQADHAQPADVIIVLGAGVQPDNTPTATMISRAQHAARLWQRGLAPVIICAGGYPGRATLSEAAACAGILLENGVPPEAIILEENSRSTEENAQETRIIMRAHNWHSAVLVSSGYHLFRARWLFQSASITSYPSPAAVGLTPLEYTIALTREVAALYFLTIKTALNLNITYIPYF